MTDTGRPLPTLEARAEQQLKRGFHITDLQAADVICDLLAELRTLREQQEQHFAEWQDEREIVAGKLEAAEREVASLRVKLEFWDGNKIISARELAEGLRADTAEARLAALASALKTLKDGKDAPLYYHNDEASAWRDGYSTAIDDALAALSDTTGPQP